jgi:hypothetical protein
MIKVTSSKKKITNPAENIYPKSKSGKPAKGLPLLITKGYHLNQVLKLCS